MAVRSCLNSGMEGVILLAAVVGVSKKLANEVGGWAELPEARRRAERKQAKADNVNERSKLHRTKTKSGRAGPRL